MIPSPQAAPLPVLGWWSVTRRFFSLSSTAGVHAAGWALRRFLVPGTEAKRRHDGERLADLLEALGPTFVKAGQVLSCRPDLVSTTVSDALRRLQDQVMPLPSETMLARLDGSLEESLHKRREEVFAEVESEPVASASIAQVHRGRLLDGRVVAIKIRRPGIEELIGGDLAIVRTGAAFLERLPPFASMPLVGLVEEIADAIVQQLDFDKEAANHRRFKASFDGTERLRWPVVLEELSSRSVLVMEFIDGLHKIDEAEVLGQDAQRSAAVVGLRALYKMIFTDGFVHVDLHPGNVFVRRWGELVILDPGLVVALPPSVQEAFVDFFFGMVSNKGLECSRVVVETAIKVPEGFDRAAFDDEMVTLIARHSNLCASDFEVTRFAVELFDLQRRFRLRGTTSFTLVILSLVVYEGIVKRLHPELDFQKEARGYLIAGRYGAPRAGSHWTFSRKNGEARTQPSLLAVGGTSS